MELFHLWGEDGRNAFTTMKIIRVNCLFTAIDRERVREGLYYLVAIEAWPPPFFEVLL